MICPQCNADSLQNVGVFSNAKSKTMVIVRCSDCYYGTVRVQQAKPKTNHHHE